MAQENSRGYYDAEHRHKFDDRDRDRDLGGKDEMDVIEPPAKRIKSRVRLFIGNLHPDTTEEEFKEMFIKYGETSEHFLNARKGFGFVRMEKYNAAKAREELDGSMLKTRVIRVKFSANPAAVKIKYLLPHVTNELLENAFSYFGEVERAVVIVDDRGKSTGEGIVEFSRKPSAQRALNQCSKGVFLMGATPIPVELEPLIQTDEDEGLPEKLMVKTDSFVKERDVPPHLAKPGSFEFQVGLEWKKFYDAEKVERENLERRIKEERQKIEMKMEDFYLEQETMRLKQEMMRCEAELQRRAQIRHGDVGPRGEMGPRGDMGPRGGDGGRGDMGPRGGDMKRGDMMNQGRQDFPRGGGSYMGGPGGMGSGNAGENLNNPQMAGREGGGSMGGASGGMGMQGDPNTENAIIYEKLMALSGTDVTSSDDRRPDEKKYAKRKYRDEDGNYDRY